MVIQRKGLREKGSSLLEFSDSYVVFDLETTDFANGFGEIIEIGAIKIIEGEKVDTFNELMNPTHEISEFITNLTGITNEMVADVQKFSEVGKRFKDFVKDYIVVAHNANFDVNFIYDTFEENNFGIFNNDFIDTLRLSRYLVKDSKNHKLKTLVKYFEFEEIGSHRAMTDAINTYKLLLQLREIDHNNPNVLALARESTQTRASYERFDLSLLESEIALEEIDKDNYFYDANVCFSGRMSSFTKREGGQLIANLGGRIQNKVTPRTDILILGDTKEQLRRYGSKSSKHRKALKMQGMGYEIQVMEESDMLDLMTE